MGRSIHIPDWLEAFLLVVLLDIAVALAYPDLVSSAVRSIPTSISRSTAVMAARIASTKAAGVGIASTKVADHIGSRARLYGS